MSENLGTPGGQTSGSVPEPDRRELLKTALRAVAEMRARLENVEREASEPIAIIGLGCRMPGNVDTPEAFWELLSRGVDAISEVPANRWNAARYAALGAALSTARPRAGFVAGLDAFDAHFFGIAPREAMTMDPQHRMVLEAAWEALEYAGLAPDSLKGSLTGVFLGLTAIDYAVHMRMSQQSQPDVYTATGSAANAAAGRVSYVLGLQGPSMAVDTACSSSLTAIHLACQSLRLRESNLALAGGVNTLIIPDWFVSMERWGMLAPDGRCKAFDAAADGMVRAEGCGVLVLKRLSDAVAAGDRVLALIRGSAVNQDGPSSGLTVPNGPAQEAVMRQALRAARLKPSDVSYVEAHGTGTTLGDPIELEAIDAVMGEGRAPGSSLVVGSVKTNVGHLEAASGVAGLIKVVLSMQYGQIPRNLNFTTLNPAITLRHVRVEVPTETIPWPAVERTRVAGVSSFGLSGTNAHVVLEEAPVPAPRAAERPHHVLTISARSATALRRQAERWQQALRAHPEWHPGDVAHTANTGRAALPHRAALTGSSLAQFDEQLGALAAERTAPGLFTAHIRPKDRQRVAFLFTGQGSQYAGMARDLYRTQAVFRASMDRSAQLLQSELDRPLLSVIYPERKEDEGLINQTAFTQPALFAIEYALFELWASWGVAPAAVMGHSVGEYVAACVAGVFSLEDALRLIAARGRLMQGLPAGGEMAAVATTEDHLRTVLGGRLNAISIAAVNAPSSMVISGAGALIADAVAALQREGVAARALTVSHAFHSALMDPMLAAFVAEARKVTFTAPRLPLVSNLTGQIFEDGEIPGPDYWARHLREAVRFADGVRTLEGRGFKTFLELGPAPILSGLGRSCLANREAVFLTSLRQERSDWQELYGSAAQLFSRGVPIDWRECDRGFNWIPVALPTYPFERERYWVEGSDAAVPALSPRPSTHLADEVEQHELPRSTSDRETSQVDDWLYDVRWVPGDDEAGMKPSRLTGTWLILGNHHGFGAILAKRMAEGGAKALLVLAPGEATDGQEPWRRVDPSSKSEITSLCEAAGAEPGIDGYVHLWSMTSADQETSNAADAVRQGVRSLLHLTQALVALNRDTQLVVATCSAQAAASGDVVNPAQAASWGLARTIRIEHPELHCRCVDLGAAADDSDVGFLCCAIDRAQLEDEVAVRSGRRYYPRLVPSELRTRTARSDAQGDVLNRERIDSANPEPSIRADATYIVTGGFGALGAAVARSLATRGAGHLVLVGRTGSKADAAAGVIAGLEGLGARVTSVAADLSDSAAVAALFDALAADPPVRGIIHSAGIVDDGLLTRQSWEQFEKVLASKVSGAWNLHRFSKHCPLDFFILFSSSAALLPTAGQSNYAAANAFLDGLAAARRAGGQTAVSMNWGPWAEGGMGSRVSARDRERWQRHGVGRITVEQGISVLERVIAGGPPQVCVLPVDWDAFAASYPGGAKLGIISSTGHGSPRQQPAPSTPAPILLPELLRQLPASERRQEVYRHVCDVVRRVFGVAPSFAIDPQQGLRDLGMDSLMAVELRNDLQQSAGQALPSTIAFDYPSVESLASYLTMLLSVDLSAPAANAGPDEVAPVDAGGDVRDLSDAEAEALLAEELNK